jgi:16S rRNA (guanine966-N2)-methyltransferase
LSSPRIIAGKAKGFRLKSVPGDTTRPITDRVKESLFNIIGGDIVGSSFLDLFAGTGSVGIEALSRGAIFCLFLDINHQAINVLKSNVEATSFKEKSIIRQLDANKFLFQIPEKPYEYIFIAPPQYKELWEKAIQILDKNNGWSGNDGWVIVQIHPIEYKKISLEHFSEIDQRTYGSTMLVFFEHNPG